MTEKASLLTGLPEGAESPQEAGDQEKEGLSPRQQRVAQLVTRLAATARSFLLYDPHNEAIHRFLTILLEAFVAALREEGPLTFDILPFELVFEGGPVYLNRDRERSLAFRLYRDGVRQIRFRPGFGWEELAKLLEILSIRYTGIHQREDDIVTLLWKAAFRYVDIVAVEGIIPDDEEAVRDAFQPGAPPPLVLPDDVDLPRPHLPSPIGPSWIQIAPEVLAGLRAEASAAHVPEDCLQLLVGLRRHLNDPESRVRYEDTAHVFGEVRDYLLSEDNLPALKRVLKFLWEMAAEDEPAWDAGRHGALYELLDTCGDRRAVKRLLRSVPSNTRKLNRELIDVLDRACPDALAAVADAASDEQGLAIRAIARQLLEHYGADKMDVLADRFQRSSGETASDLLRVIAGIGGDEAGAFIARQASHEDKVVVDEALWHLEHMPYSGAIGRAFFDAFRWTDPARRASVLGMIARTKDRRFVDLLAGYVEEQAAKLTPGEAAQIGQVLGELAGEASVTRWGEWLQATGLFRKGIEGPLARQIAAALALSEIRSSEAGEVLAAALEVAEPEAQQWILGALGQRERNFGGAV
jgi:hypothetical protein